MASIILGAGALAYDQVKKAKEKKAAKRAHNDARFSELEKENAARIAALRSKGSCFCQSSDWQGGGCEHHGYVPPAAERDRLAREAGRSHSIAAPTYSEPASPGAPSFSDITTFNPPVAARTASTASGNFVSVSSGTTTASASGPGLGRRPSNWSTASASGNFGPTSSGGANGAVGGPRRKGASNTNLGAAYDGAGRRPSTTTTITANGNPYEKKSTEGKGRLAGLAGLATAEEKARKDRVNEERRKIGAEKSPWWRRKGKGGKSGGKGGDLSGTERNGMGSVNVSNDALGGEAVGASRAHGVR